MTVRGEDGQYRYSVRMVQDITDRKLAEQRLRDSREQLRALTAHPRERLLEQGRVVRAGSKE